MDCYGAAKVLDFDMEYLLFQIDVSLRSCTQVPNHNDSIQLDGLFEITRKKVLSLFVRYVCTSVVSSTDSAGTNVPRRSPLLHALFLPRAK